jgi:hypothetical protein
MGIIRSTVLAVAPAAVLLATAAPQQAHAVNFIVNGSFEADSFSSGSGYRLGLVNNDVTGWFIPSSDGTYPWGLENANAFGAGPADTGNQWLVLGEVAARTDYTIQQTMTGLNPGSTYKLSFAIASERGCCAVGEVSFLSGSSTAAQDFTAPASGQWWTAWGHDSMNFVATSSSVTLQFKQLAVEFPSGIDLGLDSVSVTGVSGIPELGTWAMMIIGFGGVGLQIRRRRGAIAMTA